MTARTLASHGTALLVVLSVFVVVLMAVPAGSVVGPAASSSGSSSGAVPSSGVGSVATATSAAEGSYNWPELHDNAQLTGLTRNTSLNTTNAAQLGVKWAAELYGQAIDSPAIVYSSHFKETIVYIGTESGYLEALNLANGQIVWANWLGSPLVGSPVYNDGSLYVSTQRNSAMYNVNATTGSVVCSTPIPFVIEGTFVVETPPGGVRTVYVGSENTNVAGPIYALNAGNCSLEWTFTKYVTVSGTWDPFSYVVAGNGIPLLITGSANYDSRVYAINAVTGKLVWDYATYFPAGGNYDIGAGVLVSPPSVNGYASGVAYAVNKYCTIGAINLDTGKAIWSENIDNMTGAKPDCRSTFALDGTNLVFGHNGGIFDINAKTGALIWQYADPTGTEVISSPAIVGRTIGTAVVVAGDLGGTIEVVSLTTGAQLYTYQTGNYITSSPAISDGNIVIASTDSMLYDLAVNGGNDAKLPTTSISSPAYDGRVANPTPSTLTIYGNATDTHGVAAVGIGIETGGPGGPWWDGANSSWVPGPYTNSVTLKSPSAKTTAWTYALPVPAGGEAYTVQANAVSVAGQTDFTGASTSFSVNASTTYAHLKANPSTVGPGQTTTVNGGAFGRGELVTIKYLNTTLATEDASSTGYLPDIPVTIPVSAQFGLSGLTATGASTHKTATAAVEVLNNWVSNGYNSTQTGSEPNDPTFANLIEVGSGNFIHLAWNFVSGAPINASPVVASDIAYLGNTAGQVYSVSVHNGGLYWTWNGSGGSAIRDEAIDPSTNFLYVTAQNGEIYAISTVTGMTVWSALVGGNLSAPEVSTQGLYVSSTTGATGLIELLNSKTGAEKWTDKFSSEVTAAPAISDTGKLLVIGTWAGELYALNATNGKTEWTYTVDGAIKAAATVWNDSIYFGSDNHYVTDLNFNGKVVWKVKTGAPVEDTGVITFTTQSKVAGTGVPLLAIGANNGLVYAFRASSGAEWFNQSAPGAVVGVAVVDQMIVATHAGGDISGVRNYADYGLFNINVGGYLASQPVIVNGAVYVTAGTGALYVYTGTGGPPA